MHVQPEGVRLGINLVREGGVFEFFQRLARADAPAIGFDADESRRMIMGLEEEVGVKVGGEVGGDELRVLPAGLVQGKAC